MGIETAIIGSSVLAAGTALYTGLSAGSQKSDSTGSVLQMMINSQLAGIQAQVTKVTSEASANLIENEAAASSMIYDFNASQYEYAADTAIAEGNVSAQKEHRVFQGAEATGRANLAAGGIQVEGGNTSSGDIQETNQTQYYLDRDLILYGADITATQYRNQAKLATYQADITDWLGEQKAYITRAEGEMSAAGTLAQASAQNVVTAANASAAMSSVSAQANSAMLTGFSKAATSLAGGWADYQKYKGYIT